MNERPGLKTTPEIWEAFVIEHKREPAKSWHPVTIQYAEQYVQWFFRRLIEYGEI